MLTVARTESNIRPDKSRSRSRYDRPRIESLEMKRFVEQFTIPAFVVDSELAVKGLNEAGRRLSRDGEVISLINSALKGSDDTTTVQLRALIAEMGNAATDKKKDSLVLRRSSTGRALHVWGMPLAGETRKGRKLVLLFLIDPDAAAAVPTPILQSIYGFTNAEGRLVEALLNGLTVVSFAEQSNVSVNTARTHLKSIYRKTETNRQPELIRLLAQFICNINFIAHQISDGMFQDGVFQH